MIKRTLVAVDAGNPRRWSTVRSASAALVTFTIIAASLTAAATTATAAPVATSASTNVNAAFEAYNKAFLISNGSQRYYKESLNVTGKDYFWRQALDIQGAEDVYESTKSADTRTLISGLLDTFLQQNRGGGGLYDWNWNEYNDDMLWAGLAFARGYKITGNKTYLTQAQYAFDRVYDRGWDGKLGGGVWWSIKKEEKSALSNSPAVVLGSLIYEGNGNRTYLDKARAIYDWTLSHLVQSTGAVREKMNANGSLDSGETVYSAGVFISAAEAMYRDFGNQSYFDDAKRTTDYVIRSRTSNGIMTNGQRAGTWQSEYSRGMGEFVRENNLWGQYYDFMKRNADAAWNARRTDLNLTWNRWDAQTARDDTSAVEAIGAVIMQAVTPGTKPSGNAPVTPVTPATPAPPVAPAAPAGPGTSTGTLIKSTAGNLCADVPGATHDEGAKVWLWACNGGDNQNWVASGSALKVYGDMCLDAFGAGTADGTPVITWSCHGRSNQQWTVKGDGTIVGTASGKCLDAYASGATSGTKLVLWTCSGLSNQKWARG